MSRFGFDWEEWNLDHATEHGVTIEECERIVRRNPRRHAGRGKYRAVGRGDGGQWIQVVFTIREENNSVYVIHARPLTDAEKRQERKRP